MMVIATLKVDRADKFQTDIEKQSHFRPEYGYNFKTAERI